MSEGVPFQDYLRKRFEDHTREGVKKYIEESEPHIYKITAADARIAKHFAEELGEPFDPDHPTASLVSLLKKKLGHSANFFKILFSPDRRKTYETEYDGENENNEEALVEYINVLEKRVTESENFIKLLFSGDRQKVYTTQYEGVNENLQDALMEYVKALEQDLTIRRQDVKRATEDKLAVQREYDELEAVMIKLTQSSEEAAKKHAPLFEERNKLIEENNKLKRKVEAIERDMDELRTKSRKSHRTLGECKKKMGKMTDEMFKQIESDLYSASTKEQ